MNRILTLLFCTIGCAVLGTAQAPQAEKQASPHASSDALLNRNLLSNGDAEMQMNGRMVPYWGEAQDGFIAEAYGHTSGEWDYGVSGCPGCGKRYLRLAWEGTGSSQRTLSQRVDVSRLAESIDAFGVIATLSGYLGTFRDSDTTVTMRAVYLDSGGKDLGKIETAPIDSKSLPKAEAGDAALVRVRADGAVPAGTRRVEITLLARATGGSGSYLGLADNLSFVLSRKQ